MIFRRRRDSSPNKCPSTIFLPYDGAGGRALRRSVTLPVHQKEHIDDFKLSPMIANSCRQSSPSIYSKKLQLLSIKQKSQNGNRRVVILVSFCAFVLMIVTCGRKMITLKEKNQDWTSVKNKWKEVGESLSAIKLRATKNTHEAIQDSQMQVTRLVEENEAIRKKLKGAKEAAANTKKLQNQKQRAIQSRFEKYNKEIQKISRVEAIKKFGEGPHRVQFTTILMESDLEKRVPRRFVVELAPLDLMPHSVNLFLNTVRLKLWDNGMFLHGSTHIIGGMPLGQDFQPFINAGYSSVLFQEYSDKYPHLKYTLGFAGRPGGPGFYISSQDNKNVHRPYGQIHHVLEEEGDPCFGKVVEGFHVVDRMIELHKEGVSRPTVITKVRIIN